MVIRTWIILILYVIPKFIANELMGEHICEKEERYTVNVTKYYLRNITIRSYEWCVQVPPRCSVYSVREINDTKTEEEEKIRYVNQCCDGYHEVDKDGMRCVPNSCRYCSQYGDCDGAGVCHCKPGYWGRNCDKECVGNTWGVSCQNKCDHCIEGHCDVSNGNCLCPPNFIRCDLVCAEGRQISECLNECNCNSMNICDPFTKKCITVYKNYTEYDYDNSPNYKLVKNQNPYHSDRRKYHNFSTTTVDDLILPFTKSPGIQDTEKVDLNDFLKFLLTKHITTASATEEITSRPLQTTETKPESSTTVKNTIDENEDFIEKTTDQRIELPEINANVKSPFSIQDTPINASILLGNVSGSNTQEFNAISNDSTQSILIDGQLFITIISGVLFTVLIILSAAVFCVLHKLKRKKRKYINSGSEIKEKKMSESVSTVSVTARSIFHTPLPDPPIFENPIFLTPLDGTKPRTFETHVICNMNFPKLTTNNNQTKQDPPELFYDHPPSTGSYRPVSVPEPPGFDCVKGGFDPIYDEIPCNRRIRAVVTPPPSYVSEESTLYMNTK